MEEINLEEINSESDGNLSNSDSNFSSAHNSPKPMNINKDLKNQLNFMNITEDKNENEEELNVKDIKNDENTENQIEMNSLLEELGDNEMEDGREVGGHTDTTFQELNIKEISVGLDEEEKRLQELDERRKKLEADMTRLQEEISREKLFFRKAIDDEIEKKRNIDKTTSRDNLSIEDAIRYERELNPLNISKDEIEAKLNEYRSVLKEPDTSRSNSQDEELQRLRTNLALYRKTLMQSPEEKIEKRKAASKIFEKHLDDIGAKCSMQLEKLATIQRDIEQLNLSGDA